MTQYLLLIHGNAQAASPPADWEAFIAAARRSGLFAGGSALGERVMLGNTTATPSSAHIVGYMRFDADDKQKLLDLLAQHPTVVHGGTVELCEMPRSS